VGCRVVWWAGGDQGVLWCAQICGAPNTTPSPAPAAGVAQDGFRSRAAPPAASASRDVDQQVNILDRVEHKLGVRPGDGDGELGCKGARRERCWAPGGVGRWRHCRQLLPLLALATAPHSRSGARGRRPCGPNPPPPGGLGGLVMTGYPGLLALQRRDRHRERAHTAPWSLKSGDTEAETACKWASRAVGPIGVTLGRTRNLRPPLTNLSFRSGSKGHPGR